jgi:hypothetical protein
VDHQRARDRFSLWIAFAWFYEITPEGLEARKRHRVARVDLAHTGKRMDRWIIAILSVAVVLLLTKRSSYGVASTRKQPLQCPSIRSPCCRS